MTISAMSDTVSLKAARKAVKSRALFDPVADVSTLADVAVRTYLASLPSPDTAGQLCDDAMVSELVERLTERAESYMSGGQSSEHTASLLYEAAIALSSERAAHEQTKRERDEANADRDRWYKTSFNATTRLAEMEKALTELVELNDNHSPFGGELYQDRIDRTWDAARRALGGKDV